METSVPLKAIRVSGRIDRDRPERCELGPGISTLLLAAKAEGPLVYVIPEEEAALLEEHRALIIDRGRKHPAKPLSPLLIGQDRIPFIRGGHSSTGQLLRSVRALLRHAVEEGDPNVFLIGADGRTFADLWARSEPIPVRSAPGPVPISPSAEVSSLFSLLTELPVPESVRERFIGESQEARLVLQLVLRAAGQEDPVLILGDTGTGKEVVARLIHDQSSRRLQTFTAVNCGAIPKELLESELFGYEKGSHSTATTRKTGLWQRADGGTLFLDEIADLSLDHQVKILRALEHGEVRPVGAEREVKVDARVVAATNRDLFGMMQAGEFREDLYYRLRSFMIRTPALRDHPSDIPMLADRFWKNITRDASAELPGDIVTELARYRWPGNARELRMVLSSLFGLFGPEQLAARHLHAVFEFEGQAGAGRPAPGGELELHRVECLRHLRRADEVLRAAQVALRPGAQLDGTIEAVTAALGHRVSELELLCASPLLFHGEHAYGAVRRVKDRLRELVPALRDEPERLRNARAELGPDFGVALTTIFHEVDALLHSTTE